MVGITLFTREILLAVARTAASISGSPSETPPRPSYDRPHADELQLVLAYTNRNRREGIMAKLIGLFAVVAVAIGAGIAFWRAKSKSWRSMWDEAQDSASELDETAAREAGNAADRFTGAFDDADKRTSDVTSGITDAVRGTS